MNAVFDLEKWRDINSFPELFSKLIAYYFVSIHLTLFVMYTTFRSMQRFCLFVYFFFQINTISIFSYTGTSGQGLRRRLRSGSHGPLGGVRISRSVVVVDTVVVGSGIITV